MSISISEAVRQLVHNKGISEELILKAVEEGLFAAYKKKYGTTENAITRVDEHDGEVHLYSKKVVVEKIEDPTFQISLEEAKERNSEVELGDEVLEEISPFEFGRIEAQIAKQIVFQRLRDIERNIIYSEFKEKEGELIIGTVRREHAGTLYIDIGRTEGILPRNHQSIKEHFSQGDRIKALIYEVNSNPKGPSVILSRAHPEFVRLLFEQEVPEIADGTIELRKVVREAGFRTKISVYAADIDPVGACVGMKGIRIQTIVKELEGEKIDVVRYSDDIRTYIQNALSPADVERVIILSEDNREAMAVVDNRQLSIAIGKQGHNVKLACELVKWNIDVKTMEEVQEMDIEEESVTLAHQLFHEEEETHSVQLLELPESVIEKLESAGIYTIETLIDKNEKDLMEIPGIGPQAAGNIISTLNEMVEVVSDEEEAEQSGEVEDETEEVSDVKEEDVKPVQASEIVEYFCPECGHKLDENMNVCPGCGVELEFEE